MESMTGTVAFTSHTAYELYRRFKCLIHLNLPTLKIPTGYKTVKTVPLFCGYGTVNFLVSFFYAHKRPSHFFYTYPTKSPLLN